MQKHNTVELSGQESPFHQGGMGRWKVCRLRGAESRQVTGVGSHGRLFEVSHLSWVSLVTEDSDSDPRKSILPKADSEGVPGSGLRQT